MPHSVFISYSHTDRETADKVCAALEARGLGCWIAPRDVLPGADWGASIIDAINDARVMVLVYSAASNHSHQVRREVERAVAKAVTIIPFRVEQVPLGKTLEYFLATAHWMDAYAPPLEAHVARLADAVQAYLDAPARDTTGPIRAMKGISPPPLPPRPAPPSTPSASATSQGGSEKAPPTALPAGAKEWAAPSQAQQGSKQGRRLPRPALWVGAGVLAALVYVSMSTAGPEILSISFPSAIPVGPQPITGSVEFKSGKDDVLGARFVVVEATSFGPFDVRAPVAGQKQGRFNFACYSLVPQRVTLEARLVDAAGRLSAPRRFSFEAKRGASGHFQIDTPHFRVKVP